MEAIVSLLDEAAYSRIEAIWRILELKCGLKGMRNTPFPHISWHVAECYQQGDVEAVLTSMARNAHPFTVTTSGLGIFSGKEPILYILISKTEKLLHFHRSIWRKVEPHADTSSDFYTPDMWVPHITLAHRDVNKESLVCALEELAFIPFYWEVKIDNLAIVSQTGTEIGRLISRFDFPRRNKRLGRERTDL